MYQVSIDRYIVLFQETIFKLYDNLGITYSSSNSSSRVRAENRDRNVGIVLGCLAEKMAGPRAMTIFTHDVFKYLVDNLVSSVMFKHTYIQRKTQLTVLKQIAIAAA